MKTSCSRVKWSEGASSVVKASAVKSSVEEVGLGGAGRRLVAVSGHLGMGSWGSWGLGLGVEERQRRLAGAKRWKARFSGVNFWSWLALARGGSWWRPRVGGGWCNRGQGQLTRNEQGNLILIGARDSRGRDFWGRHLCGRKISAL